jgi:hypothetical protein
MPRFSLLLPFFLGLGATALSLTPGIVKAEEEGLLIGQAAFANVVVDQGYYVNSYVGASIFYELGYRGSRSVIANVEAGHVWGAHSVFDRSLLGLTSGPTHYVSSAKTETDTPEAWQVDFHATSVAHVLAGAGYTEDGYNPLYVGMAPRAELWSGAIATEFTANGGFELSAESFLTPYKTFFNGDLGKKADVINSSFGYTDPDGSHALTIVLDGLARQNSSVALVFSAGNSGPAPNSVTGAGTGYNAITVGSVGGADFLTPSTHFTSVGPSDFYNPETDETFTGVRSTVHIAAPGENQLLAFYDGLTGGGPLMEGEFPALSDTPDPESFALGFNGTSYAAPVVSGGIALLKDLARGNNFAAEAFDSRVMRSVLMAGATATHGWNNGQTLVDGVIRTTQSLDHTTGAGLLNLTDSLFIYALGTRDIESPEEDEVSFLGWDLGTVQLEGHQDYFFSESFDQFDERIELTISLNWFVNRSFDSEDDIFSEGSFADLNLEIWSVVDGEFAELVAISNSLYNNSEFLRIDLAVGQEYGFRVSFDDVVYDLNDDPSDDLSARLSSETYSVAWSVVPEPSTWALTVMALVISLGLHRRKARRFSTAPR